MVAPSSFKGYLKPAESATVISDTLIKLYPNAEVVSLPLPDGGEGTLDVFLAHGYTKKSLFVTGPEGDPVLVSYGIQGRKAFIESAECLSLSLVTHHDPRRTTSFGIGEMIIDAIDNGADDITISLGGTCSNDGGTGMALALGARFYDPRHEFLEMHGSLLGRLSRIDFSALRERISGIHFHCLSDVDNPLTGIRGASIVYGPQKGASPEEAAELDLGMAHYATILSSLIHRDDSAIPGAGAAGGLGYGCLSFLNADIASGCEKIMALSGFDEAMKNCELILFAEGKLDQQSLMGKSLSHLLEKKGSIPLLAIAGQVVLDSATCHAAGIAYEYSLKDVEETPLTKERIKKALFRVTYDAMIAYGKERAKKEV